MSAKIRGIAHGSAANAQGEKLTVASRPGDTAVLIAAAQLTAPGNVYGPPEGWTGASQAPIAPTARSGYIAWRRVTDPSDTTDVLWYNRTAMWTSRQNGVLIVFEGELEIKTTAWQVSVPTVDEDTYLISQSHGPMSNALMEWKGSGDILYDGKDTVSTTASWSALRVGLTSSAPVMGSGQVPAAWCAFTAKVALAPTPGCSWYQNSKEVPARVSVYENGTEKVASKVGVMPTGPSSVAELLKIPNFVVAHRGGSQGWVESTQHAYTDSMAYGVDALEISCARTSDGVWIANHDNNLKSLGGPDKNIALMTWADVQAAMAAMPEKMPCRLDWLLETYGNSTVIVFDPKNSNRFRDEFFGILEPYKPRIAIKFFGDLFSLFDDARARGFKSWGYAYESSKTAAWWKEYASGQHIDIFSMTWNASKETYDELKATGKPIVSHITSWTNHAQAAAALGASGTIASNIKNFKTIQV